MQILSDIYRDVRSVKPHPGSYEWWYFDAISTNKQFSIVVIFYDGNPFSRRYADAIDNGTDDKAELYPAISISVYDDDSVLFYSFEEVLPEKASFSEDLPEGCVKNNRFSRELNGERLQYRLELNQSLPNGDQLGGELTFSSDIATVDLGNKSTSFEPEKHQWNLVQPHAQVDGKLHISGYEKREIQFLGTGYHDHNTGHEPMWQSFEEWYWGRIHFSGNTLIYYLMNERGTMKSKSWLFGKNGNMTALTEEIELSDIGLNFFGLQSARKLEKHGDAPTFLIQKPKIMDNGPFYQRFKSQMMFHSGKDIYQGSGISEYINPSRIKVRLFRPLVNMRIRYPGKEHWVQKSPRFYRWTW